MDLVLIHEYEPAIPREIVPLSDEVHLDISHHAKRLYKQPRELRVDPWLGPSMCEPVFLHDPNHFFEWAQASVRGQFHRPDYMLARGAAFLERARISLKGLETDRLWLSDWTRAHCWRLPMPWPHLRDFPPPVAGLCRSSNQS